MADFYTTRFGNARLWCAALDTDLGREVVVHEPTAGDHYIVQDRGTRPVRVTCELLFDWMAGEDLEPLERWREFQSQIDAKPRIFTHPLLGSFLARAEANEPRIDNHGTISVSATFIAVSLVDAVTPAGAATIPATGANAVAAAATNHANAVAVIGAQSTAGAEAQTAAERWATRDEVSPREVMVDTASLTTALGDEAATYEDDLERFEAYRASIELAEAVRNAADAATSETQATLAVRLGAPRSLRALVASIYGADEAEQRYYDAMRLNDILNPATIPADTELVLPAVAAVARRG